MPRSPNALIRSEHLDIRPSSPNTLIFSVPMDIWPSSRNTDLLNAHGHKAQQPNTDPFGAAGHMAQQSQHCDSFSAPGQTVLRSRACVTRVLVIRYICVFQTFIVVFERSLYLYYIAYSLGILDYVHHWRVSRSTNFFIQRWFNSEVSWTLTCSSTCSLLQHSVGTARHVQAH